MKTTLVITLFALAFAFVPSAEAVCAQSVCVNQYSYGSDCNSNAANYVYASGYTAAGYVGAGAYTSCGTFFGYEYNEVGASYFSYGTPAGYAYGYAYWGEFFGYCYTYAYTTTTGYVPADLCATAGAPPGVPALPRVLP